MSGVKLTQKERQALFRIRRPRFTNPREIHHATLRSLIDKGLVTVESPEQDDTDSEYLLLTALGERECKA